MPPVEEGEDVGVDVVVVVEEADIISVEEDEEKVLPTVKKVSCFHNVSSAPLKIRLAQRNRIFISD